MTDKLPTRLNKEPLIDALFEVRFSATVPVSSVMPGVLFGELEGNKAVETLPAGQIPAQIRESDPNLRFAPVMRVKFERFIVQFSDRSVAVSCILPYPGWNEFRAFIVKVMTLLGRVNIVSTAHRYSLKYIDIIEERDPARRGSYANVSVSLANHQFTIEPCQVRLEIQNNGFINVISFASSATATNEQGVTKEGLVIDVDTIKDVSNMPFQNFLDGIEAKLDEIHALNKRSFFDCLTPAGLTFLEPIYD